MSSIIKKVLKCFIPQFVVRKIRSAYIIKMQKKCISDYNWIVDNLHDSLLAEVKPLKKINNSKIVWQYWAQGFDPFDIPDLIKVCLKSVELNTQGYELIRISDENIYEYVKFPTWINDKKAIMSKAHFSDLLRCLILSLYGGIWLDAAVFLTGDIPNYIIRDDFFLYRRDVHEKHKLFWENTFAYYFGYSQNFSVNSLIGIMYSRKGGVVISDFATMLLTFWKHSDTTPNYFFFQILIEEYFKKYPQLCPPIVNDTIPHLLRQYINEIPAPGYSFSDILKETSVHSLNYKSEVACRNLLLLFPEYKQYIN